MISNWFTELALHLNKLPIYGMRHCETTFNVTICINVDRALALLEPDGLLDKTREDTSLVEQMQCVPNNVIHRAGTVPINMRTSYTV